MMLSPVSVQMKARASAKRTGPSMPGHQNRRYSTKRAGYTATSTKLLSQLHQPT